MYAYSKEKGLIEFDNAKYKGSVEIDMISDVHLDFYIKDMSDVKHFVNMMDKSQGEILLVAGDISHKNELSKEFLTELSKRWKFVLAIPGNHDWYFRGESEDRYADLIESMRELDNVKFLMDEVKIFEYKGIKIAGTSMMYNLNEMKDYIMWKSILNDSRFISRDFINDRNEKDVLYYNKVINDVDIFVSHVPIVNLDGKETTENLFLNMDVNPIEQVLYISGHTHRPRSSVNRHVEFDAINISYGYPAETSHGRPIISTLCYNK